MSKAKSRPSKKQPVSTVLQADAAVGSVIINLCKPLIEMARQYETGVIHHSEDIENLHQYRISLRKARAIIDLLGKALKRKARKQFKKQLALLMRQTNLKRDLDVFLAQPNDLYRMLPDEQQQHLRPFFEHLELRSGQVQQGLVRWLHSEDYLSIHASLSDLLSSPDVTLHKRRAKHPLKPLVDSKIEAQFEALCFYADSLDETTDDEPFHELRIAGKKLRYLLDCFASLYPQPLVKKLIKRLKHLQDALGEFNDNSWQSAWVQSYYDSQAGSEATKAAVESLITALAQQHKLHKRQILIHLTDFTRGETPDLINQLSGLNK